MNHPAIGPGAPRILVVDDSPPTAKALSRLLSGAGYRPVVCHSGAEALGQIEREPIAGAIVDIHLGDISGLIVARRLRERLGPEATIIILSGDTSLEMLSSLRDVGATYYFSKPVNVNHLLERLNEWIPPATTGAA